MPDPIPVRASVSWKASKPIRLTKYLGDLGEERSEAENTARSWKDKSKKQKIGELSPQEETSEGETTEKDLVYVGEDAPKSTSAQPKSTPTSASSKKPKIKSPPPTSAVSKKSKRKSNQTSASSRAPSGGPGGPLPGTPPSAPPPCTPTSQPLPGAPPPRPPLGALEEALV